MPLELSDEQAELLEVLRVRDATHPVKLEPILRGAFWALAQGDNPERLSQSAQSVRELLDRLPLQYAGAPKHVPISETADQLRTVMDLFVKAKQKSTCWDNATLEWSGILDGPVMQLLSRIETVVGQRAVIVSRQERKRRFIRGLDPTGEPLPPVNELYALKEWRTYDEYFQQVAHHNRTTTIYEFDRTLTGCVGMLLGHLKPASAATLDALDALIKSAEEK
ncbi:MAG: hypothetical protein ACRENK_16020 [Gemmatimonadaceae bacterium]